MADDRSVEDLLREFAPQVLGVLMRRHDGLDACEDAVQEALLDAATQWKAAASLPENPRGWLLTVASRRLVDIARSDAARRRREDSVYLATPSAALVGPPAVTGQDDTLTLLFMCCHPALSPSSQVALTLRAVGGLTTAEIARAFGVGEPTMAQRISRAKQQVRAAGARFTMPPAADRPQRLVVVQQVLYLVFNEGYAASAGASLQRADLTAEAIRLARVLHRLLPDDAETSGLLALMLLTEARRAARVAGDGSLVPLLGQDRGLWDGPLIAEGAALIASALRSSRALGPYQIQAAIAAVHDEAPSVTDTDWAEVLALWDLLGTVTPGPMTTLGRAVAVAMVHGPEAGLAVVQSVAGSLARSHRMHAVRGHLLEMAGDTAAAVDDFRAAARYATNIPERRYLERKATLLSGALPAQLPAGGGVDVRRDIAFVQVPGGHGPGRLEHQDGPAGRGWLVQGAPGDHEDVTGIELDGSFRSIRIAQRDGEPALDHEEEFVGSLVNVPDVLAVRVRHLDVVIVDPGEDPRAVHVAEGGQCLGEPDGCGCHATIIRSVKTPVLYAFDVDAELPAGCQVQAWAPRLPGIREVFHARLVGYAYPAHCHETWAILIVDDGAIRYDLDRRRCEAAGRTVTILPPAVAHDGGPAPGAIGFRKRELYLEGSYFPAGLTGAAVDHTSISDPPLRAAISRLHDRLLHQPTLASAAAALDRSVSHVVRSFTRQFGLSPHAYLTGRRIDMARRLLLHGAAPADVATAVGFYDQAHFTRQFKRHTSTTPASYARSHPLHAAAAGRGSETG
jgi:RNA polymerase sigma factor (sigma-70 family)